MRLVNVGTGCWFIGAIIVTATMTSCTQSSSLPRTITGVVASSTASTGTSTSELTFSAVVPPSSLMVPPSGATSVRRCANGSVQDLPASSDNAMAGPVAFANVKLLGSPAGLFNFYGGGQVPEESDGSKFYKMGTLVKGGATATVTVSPAAKSYLRLQQGPAPHSAGKTSIVFQACPGRSYTGWVGGFDIKGPMPVCVALDIQVAGEPTVRHLSIPFGAPTCKR